MPTLERALAAGGEVLMRHFGDVRVEHKGAIDLVTIADLESERVIIDTIRAEFPGHAILAEESGASQTAEAEWRWIIDPLDGTTNYAHALAVFSVTIGVEHLGEIVAGGTFSPATNELYLAERGGGATFNGQPMRVSACKELGKSLLVTGFPYDRREHIDYYMAQFGSFLQVTQGVMRFGSAALDFAHVAAGRLDGYWERGLKPWDVAAGKLLIEESGGRTSDFRARRFDVYGPDFLASNGLLHDQMLAVLNTCPSCDW